MKLYKKMNYLNKIYKNNYNKVKIYQKIKNFSINNKNNKMNNN